MGVRPLPEITLLHQMGSQHWCGARAMLAMLTILALTVPAGCTGGTRSDRPLVPPTSRADRVPLAEDAWTRIVLDTTQVAVLGSGHYRAWLQRQAGFATAALTKRDSTGRQLSDQWVELQCRRRPIRYRSLGMVHRDVSGRVRNEYRPKGRVAWTSVRADTTLGARAYRGACEHLAARAGR